MNERLRLRQSGLGWRSLDGEVVALDSSLAVYVGANRSGSLLWEALARGSTGQQLAQALVDEYGLERSVAERDVADFIAQARDLQLLETEDEPEAAR